jgi:hypothetical protein
MRTTLIVVHVMPLELEMFERWMVQYKNCLQYLEDSDDVTLYATLNLNPKLTDWENSIIKQDYFISKFKDLISETKEICNIILDDSIMGTTHQKREIIKSNYDQFIFADTDIAFPPMLLKYQLEASYVVKDTNKYVIIPSIVKLWDSTWDVLVDNRFENEEYGYHKNHLREITLEQSVEDVNLIPISPYKYGCGMHTLYSKGFWDFIGIPESFGGYGPEDTFSMFASDIANSLGYQIYQYVMKGIYVSEDYINRTPSYSDKIKIFDLKEFYRNQAESNFQQELTNFKNKIKNENNSSYSIS